MRKITLFLLAILAGTATLSAATGWYNDFLTIKVNGAGTAGNYFLSDSDPASGATALNGANFGTVNTLEITGCDVKYWSDTQDRTGGAFYYKVTTSDGLTDIIAPVEVIWDQTALGGNDFQGTKTTTINISNLMLQNGTYQLHVWAKSWSAEGGQGDSWLSNNSANYVSTFTISRPVIVKGANGINENTSFPTLKAAFDSINAHSDQTDKTIEIQIAGNTTETASAVLNQPAVASWNSLTIYPTAENVIISGTFVGTIIDLNGADNVTINGKLNKTGAAKTLTISHTSNTDNGNRTIRLWNDAKNNTIQYCIITGKCPSSGAGVIFFGDAKSTLGEGNDDNIIEYNDVNAAGAANGIYASSANAFASERNIIRNNNVYDFYISNTSTTATSGINFGTNYTTTTITGNSLYQTAARDYSATTATLNLGINVGGTSNGNTISDNYIGGSAPQCGGASAWIVTGGLYRLFAIQTSLGITTASSVQNNTISNIDITSAFVTGGSSVFTGIQHSAGTANYGNLTGNIIGSTTTNGSIKVKLTGLTVGSLVVGINVGNTNTGPLLISNNKIGGIILDLNNTTNRAHLYGISTAGSFSVTITKNTIGSENVTNSFEHKGCTPTATTNLRGITVGNTGGSIIDENIIANLTSNSNGAFMTLNGIFTNSGANSQSISKNIIRNLTNYGTRASTGTLASLIGLCVNTAASSNGVNSITNNKIYTLNNATTTADIVEAYGIYFETSAAGSATLENNKIYDIKTSSTSTNANIVGLYIGNGLTTTKNNMISLGSELTTAYNISGIRKSNIKSNSFYHNSVLISGNEIGAAGTTNTYAFNKTGSGTDELKNNVFINNRSNTAGNTQKHYGIYLNDITTLTSDYNVYNTGGTGGILGAIGTTDYTDPNVWVSNTNLDSHSKVAAVNFNNATAGDLTISGVSVKDEDLKVPALASVTTDILGTTRNTKNTYAGAHEAALPFIFKAMQGTFSVGSAANSDFATLSDAVKSVNDAITVGGDIVFEINSDITEPANFGLAKQMGPNKLTIRPNTDADRTVTFTQTAANVGPYGHFVIGCATGNLNTALSDATVVPTGNVTIDGYAVGGNTRRLTFTTPVDALSGSALINIVASNATTIKNMIFNNKSTGTSPMSVYINQFKGVTQDLSPMGTVITNNQITTNASTQSGYGIRCNRSGSATTRITGLEITNNLITASGTGIEVNYCSGVNVSGNEIKVQKGTTIGSGIGVWLRGSTGDMYVVGNKFTELSSIQNGTGTYATQGILTGATSTNPFNVYIFNNMFSGMNRSVSGPANLNQTYIAEIGFGTTKIYHNTFYLPALTLPTQAGAYNAISFTTTNYKADVQNNIFISNEDAKSVLISKNITTGPVNNNIYYLRAGNTYARYVDTYQNFNDYKAACFPNDIDSKNADVEFADAQNGNLMIAGGSVQNSILKVPGLSAVTTDITGKTRDASYTYAGAHESTLPFTITGLKNTSPTADVLKTKTGIEVRVAENSNIELYSVNGTLIDIANVNATYSRNLENGIYIVKINGKAIKFVK